MGRQEHQPDAAALPGLEGEFEVIRELGRGGSSIVYLAVERELGREVAVKIIHPLFSSDADAVARLTREARTLARLEHPNIVTFYGIRRLADGGHAMVMQYVRGERLKDRIRACGPMEVEEARRLLSDVARALGHAHRFHVVHRDVKPENIYLDAALGSARLSDFGIARSWDGDASLTQAGLAIGTPAYMAPEQIDGEPLDGRSDLYSLGLVGYEMLTGERPWNGKTLYGIIYSQKHETLPPLASIRPDLPDDLVAAIEGAIEKDPDRRWPSADAFLARLLGEATGTAAAIAPVAPASAAPKAPASAAPKAPIAAERVAANYVTPAPPPRAPAIPPPPSIAADGPGDDSLTIPYVRPVHPVHPVRSARPAAEVRPVQEVARDDVADEERMDVEGVVHPGTGGSPDDADAVALTAQVAAALLGGLPGEEQQWPPKPHPGRKPLRRRPTLRARLAVLRQRAAALIRELPPLPRGAAPVAGAAAVLLALAGGYEAFTVVQRLEPELAVKAASAPEAPAPTADSAATPDTARSAVVAHPLHRSLSVQEASPPAARASAPVRVARPDPSARARERTSERAQAARREAKTSAPDRARARAFAPPPPPSISTQPVALPKSPAPQAQVVQLAGTPAPEAGSRPNAPAQGAGDAPPRLAAGSQPAPRLPSSTPSAAAPSPDAAPTFTPYTLAPGLKNPAEVRRALSAKFPISLRDDRVGGRVVVWVYVDERGNVLRTRVRQSSGNDLLDRAALEVADSMKFSPALNGDRPVAVWVSVPIVFSVR